MTETALIREAGADRDTFDKHAADAAYRAAMSVDARIPDGW